MTQDFIRTAYPGIAFKRSYWKCWKCKTPVQPWQNEGDDICSVEECGGKITPDGVMPIDEMVSAKLQSTRTKMAEMNKAGKAR